MENRTTPLSLNLFRILLAVLAETDSRFAMLVIPISGFKTKHLNIFRSVGVRKDFAAFYVSRIENPS